MLSRPQSLRALAVLAAAAAATLLAAGPAAAATVLPLHAAHRNTTAAGFGTHSCDQIPPADQGSGDGFVFVLPGNDADFVSLSLTFRNTSGGTVTVSIPDPADPYPDGITTNGASKAWVVVPSGWTLLDGTATVDNDGTKADDFNLTHTCVGTATSTSPTPTHSPSTSPSPSASASPSKSTGPSHSPRPSESAGAEGGGVSPSSGPSTTPAVPGGGSGGGSLPVTGYALMNMTLGGTGLVAAGLLLLFLYRRRKPATFVADPDADGA